MGNNWPTYPLEKCMEAIIDYRGKTPNKTSSGVPLITAKIVKGGRILPVQEYIAESEYDTWMRRGHPQKGDILITTEAPLGEVAQLDGRKVALAQRLITLRGKKGFLDNTFLKYLLQSHEVQHQIDGRASGTTVSGIKQSELRKVLLPIPDFPEQRAIAHILGSLDDKIELNRQMNETLEAMAQALFKSWFIDFDPVIDNALAAGNPIPEELQSRAALRESLGDTRKPLSDDLCNLFPSEFEFTEEMGWIPKGWEVRTLDDLVDLIGGGTPKTSVAAYWNGNIPWFSVVDAPNSSDVFVVDTEKHVTQLGVDKSSTKILPVGTTIVSARGTVGKCALVGEPMAMNQSCYGVTGKAGISDSFVYYIVREKVADLQRSGHGSVFNTITRDTFKTIRVAFAGPTLTQKLEDRIKPSFDRILANCFHSDDLSSLRDLLLPKLLSGEIRIVDSEKLVKVVE